MIIQSAELNTLVESIFKSRGLSVRDSGIISNCLIHANLRGTDSHGVLRVPHYVQRLEAGSINPCPVTKIQRTAAATAMIDGDHGFGHVTNWDAMGAAIDIAKESGIGFVGVNNSNHCGALSFYAHRAIEAGMIGIIFTQTDKGVVPYGGCLPFFGTNPLCFGIPSSSDVPVVLDMATSTVAAGHIFKARIENKPIPSTWALDEQGQPTTDPHKAAYWTPAAGAKGYGLGVIVDILTGLLSGGTFGPNVAIMYGDIDKKRNLCHLLGAIDVNRFNGHSNFLEQVTTMVKSLHEVPPAEGFDMVRAPGEPEYMCSIERSKNGIPLDDKVWNELIKLKP